MTEEIVWTIVALGGLLLMLGVGLIGYVVQLRSRVKMREMLYKERMTALSKGIDPPKEDANIAMTSRPFGFVTYPFRKLAMISGLVLLLGGLGTLWAFCASKEADLNDLASLALIPTFIGLGLILYPVVLKIYIEKV